jgi:hypothetical protein
MTIREINNRIAMLENALEFWLDKKIKAFERTQPKTSDLSKEPVKGGMVENKSDTYLIKCEELDIKINELQDDIFCLMRYVEKELERIGAYDPLMKKIIELKENTDMTWEKIGEYVHYSERQCRRIYSKYKGTRNV